MVDVELLRGFVVAAEISLVSGVSNTESGCVGSVMVVEVRERYRENQQSQADL